MNSATVKTVVSVPESVIRGLNSEQETAVVSPRNQHHLVLAGAGCGKTTVLTHRIAYLYYCGVPMQNILALTFTRKASAQMAERCSMVCCSPVRPRVTTFHSLAYHVLSECVGGCTNFSRIGIVGKARCCEERERLTLLAQCTSTTERRRLKLSLQQLDGLLERMEVFPESVDEIRLVYGTLPEQMADRFRRCRQKEGVWIFSDLIAGVVRLLSESEKLRLLYQRRYSTILVDEFQDTNPIQIQLLRQLLGSKRYLFAVGDDDQAIYGFRGADIRPTLAFTSIFQGATIFKLQTNYRSSTEIVSKANRVFRSKAFPYRKILVAATGGLVKGVKPLIKTFHQQEEAVGWVATTIRDLQKKTAISSTDIALLFRTNQSKVWYANTFLNNEFAACGLPHLLTVHKSKGLEFSVVFIMDMEETLFPLYKQEVRTQNSDMLTDQMRSVVARLLPLKRAETNDIAEERRLFYVAVTRAKTHLYLVHVQNRLVHKRIQRLSPSRFLKYIR